jgi:hypothetical protein
MKVEGGERGSDITIFFPNIAFHFFTTIKLIYTLEYQSYLLAAIRYKKTWSTSMER